MSSDSNKRSQNGIWRVQAFEPAFDDGGSSGRARANVMHDEAAQALYDFMDAEAKERYMRGFDKLPGETGEKPGCTQCTGHWRRHWQCRAQTGHWALE